MPKITELFAFVAQDKDEDDEGLMAFQTKTGWMPMVGADMGRVVSLKVFADAMVEKSGKTYRILRFKLAGEIAQGES